MVRFFNLKSCWKPQWLWRLAGVVVVAAGLYALVSCICEHRVAAMIRRADGLELQCRMAWYLPPNGIILHGVRITKHMNEGTLQLAASQITLKWQRSPTTEPSSPNRLKLKELTISEGQLTCPLERVPIHLEHIHFRLARAGDSSQVYDLSIQADESSVNRLRATGSFNADTKLINLAELSMRANVQSILTRALQESPFRARIAKCNVDGKVDVYGTAIVSLADLRHPALCTNVKIDSTGTPLSPGASEVQLQADMEVRTTAGLNGASVVMRHLQARTGSTRLVLGGAHYLTAADGLTWSLADVSGSLEVGGGVPMLDRCHTSGQFDFTASAGGPSQLPWDDRALLAIRHDLVMYARGVSIQPPKYPVPVAHIDGGPITFRNGVIRFENLSGDYGGDKLVLDEAHLTLADPGQNIHLSDLRRQVRIAGIVGTLICRQPGPPYPVTLGKVVAQLRPSGPFAISGWYAINRRLPEKPGWPKPDFSLRVSSVQGDFALTDQKIPLKSIHGAATITPKLVDIENLRGDFLGGVALSNGKIIPGHPFSYEGSVVFREIDLERTHHALALNEQKPVMGRLYLKSVVSGKGPGGAQTPTSSLAAKGEFEIIDGNFGNLTALRAAADNVTHPGQQIDGSAAGIFMIRDRVVTLDNFAVGNPVYGIQGSGNVAFDKHLDLHVVAAPLGDWKEALKRRHIPVLDDIAGAVQQLFNGAQRVILLDIKVTGTWLTPKVTVVPAPMISKPLAALFGGLMQSSKDHHLIDHVRIEQNGK